MTPGHLLSITLLSLLACGRLWAADDVMTLRYPGSAKAGELSCDANFYLYLPPHIKIVRGVIVHQHGCGDGAEKGCLAAAEDLHWRALAEKHDCALLGTSYRAGDSNCMAWADPRRGSHATFLRALRDFAETTKHPEIADAPWCLWGHSGGGWWASVMLALEPRRCVAVWLRSGSAYGGAPLGANDKAPPEVSPEMLRVPVMGNPGAKEKDDERFKKAYSNTFDTFRDWRAKGALIGFAADPRANHDCGGSRYLAIPFFDTCLAARLPEQRGAALKEMPAENAWLAALDGTPQPMADFTGDQSEAVWLPDAAFAKAWSEYVKTATVSDSTPPPAPFDVQVREGVLTWQARADFESGLRGFLIERDGQPLATLPEQQNERAVFQGLSFHDTPSQPVPVMRFTDPAPNLGAKYRVIAVNTAGLKSEPSEETSPAARTPPRS